MANEQPDAGASESGNDSGVALVWMGAGLVLASWVIFEIIVGEYFVSNVGLVLAASLVILPRLAPKALGRIAPLSALTKLGGYALAFSGVVELLDDLRFDGLEDFASVVGGLIAYAGYVLAFLGARNIKD